MSYLQANINTDTLIWPITQQGKNIVQQFTQQHTHSSITERVKHNTLAVWVMHDFLNALGVPTDLATSDSWNPAIQLTEDVADLMLPNMGRLECRPVFSSDNMVPLEALADRIGYVAIALNEVASEASILGFVAKVSLTKPQLVLEQLRSMEEFPCYLQQIIQETAFRKTSHLTRLSQWLERHFDNSWQSVDDLLAQYRWTPAFRQGRQPAQQELPTPIKRAKQLDISLTKQVAMVLEVGEYGATVNMAMRLYPLGDASHLPEGLKVTILDEANTVCLAAQSRSIDDYLQLHFRGRPGEPFTIQVAFEEVCIAENFVI